MKITHIIWDRDICVTENEMEYLENLPDEVEIPNSVDNIVDYLADTYGFLAVGYWVEEKSISIDNGVSTCTVEEALENLGMETLVHYMDDDAREQTHMELAPCTEEEFLHRYLQLAPYDLVIG